MDIPKFHETFLPILQVLKDGKPMSVANLKKRVRDEFYGELPKELIEQETKSGDSLIMNRIAWGKAYLKQAGMIIQPERAIVQISEKGINVLKRGNISLKELLHDQEFIDNRKASKKIKDIEEVGSDASPQDLIDSGIREIEDQVKAELLTKLKTIDPYYFQKVILLLLEKMGYGSFWETPKSGDGGIDGIINEDKLGLDKIYIQAKRYSENKVREGEIRNFIGAMGRDTSKGIFVTTSSFDERAIQKAKDAGQKIITIDGQMLVDLMYKYGVGVQISSTYEMRQIDEDFFEDQ